MDAYLSELIDRLEGLLGDDLVSAWLVGSGALGDLDLRRSDIDVQAVCSVRLPPDAEPRFWFVLDIAVARQRARRLAGARPGGGAPKAMPQPGR